MSIAEANVAQAAYWSDGLGGRGWVAEQEGMDRQLAPLGDAAIEAAAIQPGEAVLDVGCGCGATTLRLAELTGPTGRVLGADISTPMTQVANERLEAAGHAQASAVVADAQVVDASVMGGLFDVIFSRFGVMFFADPVAAFTNLRSHTNPGGRLAFVCWQSPKVNRMFSDFGRELNRLFPNLPAPDPLAPGPTAFADAERVMQILTDAGWSKIEISECIRPMQLFGTADFEEAFQGSLQIGGASRMLIDADEEMTAMIHDASRRVLQSQWGPNGAIVDGVCWIVRAQNT
jgi:ubiquinone/menaquinone biosynthesis C-methylase UbiE